MVTLQDGPSDQQILASMICVCGVNARNHQGKDHPFMLKDDYDPATWKRGSRFAHEDIQPAAPLYILVEDRFRLSVLASQAAVEIDVTIRLQRSDGQVVPIRQQFFPALSAAVQNFDFDLTEGFLLDISVTTPTTAVRVGAVFVVAQIIRQSGANAQPSRTLLSNYVSSGNVIGWPEGPNQQSVQGAGVPVSLNVANPVAGADWTFTVAAGTRVLVQSLSATLVTSSTVATRQVQLIVQDASAHILFEVAASGTQAASLTNRYSACGGIQPGGAAPLFILPIPDVSQLLQGWAILSSTGSIQAGDQWSGIWLNAIQWVEL